MAAEYFLPLIFLTQVKLTVTAFCYETLQIDLIHLFSYVGWLEARYILPSLFDNLKITMTGCFLEPNMLNVDMHAWGVLEIPIQISYDNFK